MRADGFQKSLPIKQENERLLSRLFSVLIGVNPRLKTGVQGMVPMFWVMLRMNPISRYRSIREILAFIMVLT